MYDIYYSSPPPPPPSLSLFSPSLSTSPSPSSLLNCTHLLLIPNSPSDPNTYSMMKVNRSVSREPALRMQNLQLLIRNIKHFYLTQLQQLVITGLPNITHIAHSPETGKSLSLLINNLPNSHTHVHVHIHVYYMHILCLY